MKKGPIIIVQVICSFQGKKKKRNTLCRGHAWSICDLLSARKPLKRFFFNSALETFSKKVPSNSNFQPYVFMTKFTLRKVMYEVFMYMINH